MDPNQESSFGTSQPKMVNLKENASALAQSAKAKLGDAVEPVKEKAIEVAAQQKDAGADQIRIVARAVHGAASELESEMPQFAGYIHDAGQRLEQAASQLRNGNVDEMVDKLGQFARAQPLALFGGSVLAGFALTRFLKSSAQHSRMPNPGQGGTA